ncbi:hypothetical protein ACEN2J_14475 [Pseudorhodobacter sp. W20_MBD10_FR17]|uniref:hypothetical protein n=1 Tax=Pseudorhodobacter sp. W20_MBD10_FR17 TaxID=3240266 RepID=UPI003F9A91C3
MTIDMSQAAQTRRQIEADARLARLGATGEARTAARKRVMSEIEGEELATANAEAAKAEATTERQRIAAVVRAGRDRDRGQQALRAALLAPIGAEAAAGLIAALPTDGTASADAVAVPGFASFGTPAAQAERRRIASAFAHPGAQGRFAAVCAMILDGDASLTAEQIAPLLATMPTGPVARTPGPGARAAGLAEFGGEAAPARSKSETAAAGWKRAAAEANRLIGAGTTAAAGGAGQAGPLASSDQYFGMTPEGRAAAEALRRARG